MLYKKKEDGCLIDVEHVEATYCDNCAFFAALASLLPQFVTPSSVLLRSYSVQRTSPSSLVCSLFYPVGVIRLNIATTSARRLKYVL